MQPELDGNRGEMLNPQPGQEWREKFGDNVIVVVGADSDDPGAVAIRHESGATATLSRDALHRSYVLL